MSSPRHASKLAALVVLALIGCAGCAAPSAQQSAPSPSPGVHSSPTAEAEPSPQPTTPSTPSAQPDEPAPDTDADGEDQGDADGGEDPAQDLVRTGPVAQYGGPAYGDQGEAEIVGTGVWCKTIAVFWGGGEPIPEGVRFTFEQAVTDRPGLGVDGGVCGTLGADRSCLGMAVEANASGLFCSLVLHPAEDFQDGTSISFHGTLSCPSVEVCDAVAAREVQPGPPIVVNTPAGA